MIKNFNMDTIFIGMPVYNSARFISDAIDSLRKQTYTHWSLLISDNASEDETLEICKKYCRIDNRITYHRQDKNIGAINNFKYLLDRANSNYFTWMAADDLWHPEFLSSCIRLLNENRDIGMAFSNIVNIDSFGRIIRTYPSFEKFSGKNSFRTIFNYVKDPEILGKANLIYSVYRLEICKKVWNVSSLSDEWGSDMCFVLAAISRSGLCISNKVLFQKRIVRTSDKKEFVSEIKIINLFGHIFPLNKSFEYIKCNLRAVKGTKYFFLVLIIMLTRMPRVFFNSFLHCISYVYVKNIAKNQVKDWWET